ncbi:hypothetical protein N2152v2_011007 [Parachlorella kessleri]
MESAQLEHVSVGNVEKALPGAASGSMVGADSKQALGPSWRQLGKLYWQQYVFVFGTWVILTLSERLVPYHHVMYNKDDDEFWKYSYPLRKDQVPPWAVPVIAFFGPACIILGFYLSGRLSRMETHHAILMAAACVSTNGVITNLIKVGVGRHRPSFVARCWPSGGVPVFDPDGRPKCADDAVDPDEGRKSFPSGHTSWSTAGLGYLTFWLLGKTRCFDGTPNPARFVVCLLPLGGALWIGLTRLQDYWHHVEDVAAGFALGLLMAYCFYRQLYPGVLDPRAGTLTASLAAQGGNGVKSASGVFGPLMTEVGDSGTYDRGDSRV